MCGLSCRSFSVTGGGSVMSESSTIVSQGSDSAGSVASSSSSVGGSWDPQAEVPEQLRWISGLPGASRMRAYERADRQIRDVGACEHPIWLRGSSLAVALASGEVIGEFSSADTPFGRFRCGAPGVGEG
jgi:hypothetical protein